MAGHETLPVPGRNPFSLVIIAKSFSDNAIGRVQVLWWLAQAACWRVEVVSLVPGGMWRPLQGSAFEADCRVVDEAELPDVLRNADLVIAAKPFPETLGAVLPFRKKIGFPLLVDVDDPDLEVRFPIHHPAKLLVRVLTKPRVVLRAARYSRLVRHLPTFVSNPVLQRWHGGTLLPHVRPDPGIGAQHRTRKPSVVFVGTNRVHKGVGVLRAAVALLKDEGFTLTITDQAPKDARSWEHWVGRTSLEAGKDLVSNADIVVIPSMPRHTTSEAQLPAKLVDAMLAGRAIVVSDFEPLTWAVGSAGIVVRPGSSDALASALRSLQEPSTRASLGAAARQRALGMFTVEAQRTLFMSTCAGLGAVRGGVGTDQPGAERLEPGA